MDKLTLRKPVGDDLTGTFQDMATLRTGPAIVMSAAGVFLATGSLILTLVSVGMTSFIHALWARIVVEREGQVER